MNLNEVVVIEELSEEVRHSSLQMHYGLIGWYTQINDPIVESHILLHNGLLVITLLFFVVVLAATAILCCLVEHNSRGVLDLEWKHGS